MAEGNATRLRGQLVRLRPMTMGDVPDFFEISRDWDVAKMTGTFPWPFTLPVARARVARAIATNPRKGQEFAIILKGKFVGSISITKLPRQPQNTDPSSASISGSISGSVSGSVSGSNRHRYTLGYHIGKSWWGQGLASDAVQTLLAWAQNHWGPEIIIEAGHYTDNPKSGRVLLKNGFNPTGEIKKVYCRSRAQWLASVEYEWAVIRTHSQT